MRLKNRFDRLKDVNFDEDTNTSCDQIIKIILEKEASTISPPSKTTTQKTADDIEMDQLNSKRKEVMEKENKSTREKIEYAKLVKTTRAKNKYSRY